MNRIRTLHRAGMCFVTILALTQDNSVVLARKQNSQITFHDIAANGGAGIAYHRAPSATNANYEAQKHQPAYTFADLLATPD